MSSSDILLAYSFSSVSSSLCGAFCSYLLSIYFSRSSVDRLFGSFSNPVVIGAPPFLSALFSI
jgi:hypothetical protein